MSCRKLVTIKCTQDPLRYLWKTWQLIDGANKITDDLPEHFFFSQNDSIYMYLDLPVDRYLYWSMDAIWRETSLSLLKLHGLKIYTIKKDKCYANKLVNFEVRTLVVVRYYYILGLIKFQVYDKLGNFQLSSY